jgi:hypothetical protein
MAACSLVPRQTRLNMQERMNALQSSTSGTSGTGTQRSYHHNHATWHAWLLASAVELLDSSRCKRSGCGWMQLCEDDVCHALVTVCDFVFNCWIEARWTVALNTPGSVMGLILTYLRLNYTNHASVMHSLRTTTQVLPSSTPCPSLISTAVHPSLGETVPAGADTGSQTPHLLLSVLAVLKAALAAQCSQPS